MEWARLQELNSLNLIQMGSNRKWVLGRSRNDEIFGGASIKVIRIVDKVWRSTRSRKGMGIICKCVMVNSKIMEYLL